jgi:hypothetical protein
MWKSLLALADLVAVLWLFGCAGREVKSSGQTLTVFLSRAEPGTLCRVAGQVRVQRQSGPVLWLVTAGVFEPGVTTFLTDGEATVRLLGAAGVDAVLLTPDWLQFGLTRLGQLVSRAQCYVLGANLLDSAGQPLGHQFMIKRSNGIEVGMTGLWWDTLGRVGQVGGVQLGEPGFAAAKTAAVMRQRAGIVGALSAGSDSAPASGFDFLAGTGSDDAVSLVLEGDVSCYGLRVAEGMVVSAQPVRLDLAGLPPDSSTKAVCDSIDRAVEATGGAVVVHPRGRVSADELTRALVKGYLALKQADAWLYDGPLFRAGWDGAAIAKRDLVTLLYEPGRPVLLKLTGSEVRRTSRSSDLMLTLSSSMTANRLSDSWEYRVAVTRGFLARHPHLPVKSASYSPQPLWTIAADVLQSWQVRR